MLSNMKNAELRDLCRTTIETLEIWLRRLIDQQLREAYGVNYLQYQDESGNFIVKKSVREGVLIRRTAEPKRYPRDIDAVLLDDSVSILLNPSLYKKYFRSALISVFPIGADMGKVIFDKITEPRNYLAHANHISIRQAEQILCYSRDIIDSIKGYYIQIGVDRLYNVPSIIQFSDSLGNIKYDSEISELRNSTFTSHIDLRIDNKGNLHPGDTLNIEVEIDPSFQENQYSITWVCSNNKGRSQGKRFEIKLENSDTQAEFLIYCLVTSNEEWHLLGDCDERLGIIYRVLPPIRN